MGLNLALLSLFLFVAGERALPEASPFLWLSRGLAGLCCLLALLLQIRRPPDRTLLALLLLTALGMGDYVFLRGAGMDVLAPAPLLSYLVPLTLSGFGLLSLLRARQTAPFDHAGAQDRARSALAFGLLCVALGVLNAFLHTHDLRRDFSYRRPSEPSAAARELLTHLKAPLEVTLLFEPGNEVEAAARPYFEALASASAQLRVGTRDAAAVPMLVKDARVRGNGYVVLSLGQRHEAFLVGRDLNGARPVLRALDGHLVHHLSALLVPARRVYLSEGHGERSVRGAPDQERGQKLADLEVLLARFNVQLARLGLTDGLGRAIPDDAALVMVLGPREPLLEAERASLEAYLARGGKVLLALEPGSDGGLLPLLSELGIGVSTGVVSCTEHHLVRTRTALDRELVYSSEFVRGEALPLSGARVRELGAVFVRSAAVFLDQAPQGVKSEIVLRAPEDCTTPGRSGPLGLVATAERSNGARAVVLGDADFFTDQILRNTANTLVTLDLVRFLLGKDVVRTEVLGDQDVPLEHTATGERVFFYVTAFAMPLALLALSFAVRRRRVRAAHG